MKEKILILEQRIAKTENPQDKMLLSEYQKLLLYLYKEEEKAKSTADNGPNNLGY